MSTRCSRDLELLFQREWGATFREHLDHPAGETGAPFRKLVLGRLCFPVHRGRDCEFASRSDGLEAFKAVEQNYLTQPIEPTNSNENWTADIPYIPTKESWR